jgi:signal transduction histidine kinase/DNA-binding response OmpR family regulator
MTRLLLVDDDLAFTSEFEKLLAQFSEKYSKKYSVFSVVSADEALNALNRDYFDAVLLDVHLRDGGDGFDCLRSIRGRDNEIIVIMITGLTERYVRTGVAARDLGANGYVMKSLGTICQEVDFHIEVEKRQRETKVQVDQLFRRNRELEFLNNVAGQFARESDNQHLLYMLAERIREQTGAERVSVKRVMLGSDLLESVVNVGILRDHDVELRVGDNSVSGQVAKHGELIIVDDVESEQWRNRVVKTWDRVRSEICLAMKTSGGTPFAVVNAESSEVGHFGPWLANIAQSLANLASASYNKNQYKEDIAKLNEIGYRILGKVDEYKGLLNLILEHAQELTGAKFCYLGIGETLEVFNIKTSCGLTQEELALVEDWVRSDNLEHPQTRVGLVYKTGEASYIEDVRTITEAYRPLREDILSQFTLPFTTAGTLQGVLSLEFSKARPVDEPTQEVLKLFAKYAAMALMMAGVIQEARERAVGVEIVTHLGHQVTSISSIMIGKIEDLKREPGLSEKSQENLDQLEHWVKILDDFRDRLRNMTKPGIQREPHRLAVIAEGQLELMRSNLKLSDIEFEFGEVDETLICYVDVQAVDSIVHHLLENAAEAVADCRRKEVSVRVYQDGDWGILECTDTGRGISEQVRSRLFKRSVTTKGTEGTGLALYCASIAMERMRGEISLENRTSGQGAVATLKFPLVDRFI